MFTNRLRFILILSAILVSVSWIANAGTVTLSFTGYTWWNYDTSSYTTYYDPSANEDIFGDGSDAFSPYHGQINSGPVIDIWCVDYVHSAWPGDSFTANTTSLAGDSNSFGNTYLNDKTKYLAIAWLITQYQNLSFNNSDTPTFEQAEYQYAIWSFTGLGWEDHEYVGSNPTLVSAALGLQATALGMVDSVDPSGWTILTDTNRSEQEFMVQETGQETVPEPSLLLMLLIGLSAVCVYCYRAGCS